MLASRLLQSSTKLNATKVFTRSLSTTNQPIVPRITEKRTNEVGPGGRGSDADLKVAVFGASGMLGRYVCTHLGT
jgi:hypothetical protein